MQGDWNPWSVIVGLFGMIFEKSKDDFYSASSEEPKFQQYSPFKEKVQREKF
jgi:hypothetical protein